MTIHICKNAAVSALALLACTAPAFAAGDYHIKFAKVGSLVDGDTEGKDDGKHSDWILIESVQLGTERTAGGVTVASGDVNGDGTDAATGRRTYEPITIRKRIDKSTPAPTGDKITSPRDAASGQATGKRAHGPIRSRTYYDPAPSAGPGNIAAPDPDPETTALLLPAVQNVREAAARMKPWAGCAAGQKIEGMTIKQVSTGRMGRILDPVVVSCATESVSFNFTKIEWK